MFIGREKRRFFRSVRVAYVSVPKRRWRRLKTERPRVRRRRILVKGFIFLDFDGATRVSAQ